MHLIHRGIVNKNYKENLLNSFKQSFKKGFGIETDIHATKDNKFVCYHDFTLTRIFKKKQSVKNLTYQKLKEISLKQNKPITLLQDLLKISKNKFYLFIEIKPKLSTELLKKLINETSKYSKCVFISFKHQNIFNLLKLNKKTKVGLSFSPPTTVKSIVKKSWRHAHQACDSRTIMAPGGPLACNEAAAWPRAAAGRSRCCAAACAAAAPPPSSGAQPSWSARRAPRLPTSP